MRVVMTQMGARRGYAVPLILEQAGMLERFYTDLAGNIGFGSWLAKGGGWFGFRKAAARLRARQVPEVIRSKTVTFPARACWHAFRSWSTAEPAERFRRQLHSSRALGRQAIKRGLGNATHVYTMLGEAGPLAGAARQQGLAVLTEIYVLLSTERIVAEEQRLYSDWEPAQPNLDAIRNEFPEQSHLLADTDFAICPSEAVRDDLATHFAFERTRSEVVPYGVDARWLQLSANPKRGRVLFVGTAGLRKGIQYLAAAAEKLNARGRRYEFRIAGDVTAAIKHQAACKHLTFLGRVPREQIDAEFALADIFVLPTLAEGSAEATYEAMAAGLPLVTTASSGTVAEHGTDALLVPEHDASALAGAIEQIIENRELRAEMSAAARKRAHDYTIEGYGQRLQTTLLGLENASLHHHHDTQPVR
jgi:glycosyltransferase involved in cell wall biosynthesis